MHIELTPEQRALSAELREYFGDLMTPERRSAVAGETMGPPYRALVRQMGSDGWLGVGWPKEHGGRGFGPLEQLIFLEEAAKAGAPVPMVTLNTVGPTIAQFGTEQQKQHLLPGILAGEIHFAIGYTESTAGTDLASLRTRADRDGDEFVVRGHKIFTTGGHDADYIWLACRTDPEAPNHKAISILVVDTRAPGFSWTPIWTLGGGHTNATYYDDVRVPADMLVGELHGGWRMVTTQLNFERVSLGPAAGIFKNLDAVTRWATATVDAEGRRVIDREWVRLHLARVRAKAEVAQLFNWRVASRQAIGALNPADASALKVYGTELRQEALRLLMEVLGVESTVARGTPGTVLGGELEVEYRAAVVGTFGGGVNEIQREIIAAAGLGMPRVPR